MKVQGARDSPSGKMVVFYTSQGDIRVRLRDDISPTVAAHFYAAAEKGCNSGCEIYRSEAVPEPGAVDNYGGPGPPYALVQVGRCGLTPTFESTTPGFIANFDG